MRRTLIPTMAAAILVLVTACSGNDDQAPPQSAPTVEETASPAETVSPMPQPDVTPSPTPRPEPKKTIGRGASPPVVTGNYGDACFGMDGWNTAGEFSDVMSGDQVSGLRAGRQDEGCDRLVFQLNGDAPVGYIVEYGPVTQDGSGDAVSVEGAVDMLVVINAWAENYDSTDAEERFADAGTYVYPTSNPKGLEVVAAVKSAGTYEGKTTFAVGLKEKAHFRAFTGLHFGKRVFVLEFSHE